MSAPIYELRNLVQTHAGREVLRIDSLDVPQGDILGISGHNGSGKSTLLAILAFLKSPALGEIRLGGEACTVSTPGVRRRVTLLTQEPYLLKRSVRANVEYGLRVRGEKNLEPRVRDALAEVGLDPDSFMDRSWRALSGGEAQRVALAARLVLRPQVLLLDEPTSNLDPESADRIHCAALAARDRGTSLVAVSHDMDWLRSVSDMMVTLKGGVVAEVRIVS